jgi:hypothetical protein
VKGCERESRIFFYHAYPRFYHGPGDEDLTSFCGSSGPHPEPARGAVTTSYVIFKDPSHSARKLDSPPVQERKATPLNSDDEAPPLSYDQERALARAKKMAGAPLEKSSQANESKHTITTRSEAKKASRAGGLRPGVVPG